MRARRATSRSPGEIVRRLVFEAKAGLDRTRGAPSARFDDAAFARLFRADDIDALWEALRAAPYPALTKPLDAATLDAATPGESARIAAAALRARGLQVDLLGSGLVSLGAAPPDIDWQADFKSGHRWPLDYFRDLDLTGLGRSSDVKVPWELSRLQWLIPVGQDFLLCGDPAHAAFARDVLASWIVANPYARGANWGVAMEAAMRIFTWTWLFHVFAHSDPWQARDFRGSFLRSIYDHAIFCTRYLEDFGASTNHLIADAAGIAVAGLFLGPGPVAGDIAAFGLDALRRALPRQLASDGVNHEGSAAYHRLVAELVLIVVRYRNALGLAKIEDFGTSLARMGEVTAALTGPDGLVPAWGDSDDGRVLPFGGQPTNDHSYLPVLIRAAIGAPVNRQVNRAAAGEIVWSALTIETNAPAAEPSARAFPTSGLYVMAGPRDHVVIDCGPAGHAHGHNDALAFEAVLDGVRLITDSGSYVYSASPEERNAFRSAAAHNAPIVDGREPNRIIRGELFLLRDDANPAVVAWQPGEEIDRFSGTHDGFLPVRPTRALVLDKRRHRLSLRDEFAGPGVHAIVVRIHFSAGATLRVGAPGRWTVGTAGRTFEIALDAPGWEARATTSWESPRYGVKSERCALELARTGALAPLTLEIYPL